MSTVSNLHGRIIDVDAHMAIPAKLWASEFGEAGARARTIFMNGLIGSAGVSEAIDVDRDDAVISAESIAQVRGSAAPGAIDTARRIEVLDLMGVSRSLIFPTGLGLIGMFFASGTAASVGEHFPQLDYDSMNVPALGRAIIAEHNAWALRKNAQCHGRLRFVGLIPSGSLAEMEAEAQRLVDGGIGALLIASSIPPGGYSPADSALDMFWAYCAESNVPVVFHVGGEGGFMKTRAWRENVENFKYRADNLELTVEPYTLATNYFAPANFLTTMVLGAVFERHPRLRVGVMELAGNWVGPLADNLDFWAEHPSQFKRTFAASLGLRPSEYLLRNVRVSPFYFEPVDDYLKRYPQLAEVFCFATDYPHREGGSSPLVDQWERVAPLGQPMIEKFFCENGKWLLP